MKEKQSGPTKNKIEIGLEQKKPIRSISGVTPLTVVLKPRKCNHGTCIYCPGGEFVPQSYTNESPAVRRALRLNFDPFEQTKSRLDTLKLMKHQTEKIEIIILGGTFLQYEKEYKYSFIKSIFDALNECESKDLEEAKKINETAKQRCVALCIENRPDNCTKEDIKEMLEFGCTRVELGVQMIDDELYKTSNRGHSVKDVIDATKRLKEAGFKVGYHIMPGLPYSNKKKDIELFKKLFTDEDFRPDQLKIYPCQVIEDSPLARIHKKINYKPYTREETKEIVEEMLKIVPEYCRVMRVMREFPKEKLIEGVEKLSVRKEVEEVIREKEEEIKEIRFREIGFNMVNKKDLNLDLRIEKINYFASGGNEFFLEVVNKKDILFGLLRLRLPKDKGLFATIRELHIYGPALSIGEIAKDEIQHKGLGKKLLLEAEKIAKESGFKKLRIISGVGVRKYYEKLGYTLDKEKVYMEKALE